ncbi:hypothetical protein FQA39_LY08695 [Lamprigera yunnana]|nr:hypothetical protein FQA39_LY08695 [Lamprigera yunnana]
MSDSNQDKKKKLSGYQNLIRKREQEEERDKNTTKISKYFTVLPFTSKKLLETETSHFIDEGVIKSDSKNPSCTGINKATVYVNTILEAGKLEYFWWKTVGNGSCNYGSTAPNV